MNNKGQALAKLREYAHQVKGKEYDEESRNGEEAYEFRLNRALQQLQEQVKEHESAIEKVTRFMETSISGSPLYD